MVELKNKKNKKNKIIYIDPYNKNEKRIYKFLNKKNIKHGITLIDKFNNAKKELIYMGKKNYNLYIQKLFDLFLSYYKITLKKCYKIAKINKLILKLSQINEEIDRYILSSNLFLSHFIWQNYNIKIDFKFV